MTDHPPLHPTAVGFSMFRALSDGGPRQYSAVTYGRGWPAAERFLRMCRKVGWIPRTPPEEPYGVLDALDEEGDIVQTFRVRDARAFQSIKRCLGLTVERDEDAAATPFTEPEENQG